MLIFCQVLSCLTYWIIVDPPIFNTPYYIDLYLRELSHLQLYDEKKVNPPFHKRFKKWCKSKSKKADDDDADRIPITYVGNQLFRLI